MASLTDTFELEMGHVVEWWSDDTVTIVRDDERVELSEQEIQVILRLHNRNR